MTKNQVALALFLSSLVIMSWAFSGMTPEQIEMATCMKFWPHSH